MLTFPVGTITKHKFHKKIKCKKISTIEKEIQQFKKYTYTKKIKPKTNKTLKK